MKNYEMKNYEMKNYETTASFWISQEPFNGYFSFCNSYLTHKVLTDKALTGFDSDLMTRVIFIDFKKVLTP